MNLTLPITRYQLQNSCIVAARLLGISDCELQTEMCAARNAVASALTLGIRLLGWSAKLRSSAPVCGWQMNSQIKTEIDPKMRLKCSVLQCEIFALTTESEYRLRL